MFEFRDLTADEIEVRVGTISRAGTGLSLLLYKDARCDMAILDETVGPMNWQRRHYDCKGNLFCGIAINRNYYDTTLEPVWIEKSDCGVESRQDGNGNEKKGEASDSFKRAGTNWGIGRELYTSPFIWLDAATAGLKKNDRGGYETKKVFAVNDIKIVNKKITGLSISDVKNKKIIYEWGDCIETDVPEETVDDVPKETVEVSLNEPRPIPPETIKEIKDYFAENKGLEDTLKHYNATKIEELTPMQVSAILNRIKARRELRK